MKCRLCQHSSDHQTLFFHQQYQVKQCRQCAFATLDPLPTAKILSTLYNEPGYHDDKTASEHQADALLKSRFVGVYLKPGASILDYGCGTGHILKVLKQFHFNPVGYDWAKTAADQAASFCGCPVKSGEPAQSLFKQSSLDAITSFDVLEHIDDFQEIIAYWHHWLKPSGLLFLTTPDLLSWDARLFKKNWYGFTKIPQHLNYFDRHNLSALLHQSGFRIQQVKTWGFSRSLGFIASKFPAGRYLNRLLQKLGISQQPVYLPMIDMMIVAQKRSEKRP